nr:MAG TPA: hypothetical protein [Caudoviricetes sp.]
MIFYKKYIIIYIENKKERRIKICQKDMIKFYLSYLKFIKINSTKAALRMFYILSPLL